MAGKQDFWEFFDDFCGAGATISTSGLYGSPWVIADTSSAGTPLYKIGVDAGTGSGAFGVATLEFDTQTEAQNVCLSFGDVLQMDVNDRLMYECRLKQNQATADSNTSFAFGLTGDRNDTIDTIASAVLFRYIGSNAVVCESDDGTTDKDDIATNQTLTTAYKLFKIDLTDLTSVKFYMTDGNSKLVRVCATTTFDISAYGGNFQPFFQLQKASDNNADKVSIDYVRVTGRRIN